MKFGKEKEERKPEIGKGQTHLAQPSSPPSAWPTFSPVGPACGPCYSFPHQPSRPSPLLSLPAGPAKPAQPIPLHALHFLRFLALQRPSQSTYARTHCSLTDRGPCARTPPQPRTPPLHLRVAWPNSQRAAQPLTRAPPLTRRPHLAGPSSSP